MNDKASEKTVQYRTRYDYEVMNKLEEVRAESGKGISQIVNEIVKDYFEDKEN
ncbi:MULTISPECIES: hypothetical protein [Gammaproteobacteria]|uniref:hypothetical protein n=1 Tax=Gammaproteobacteria TaxID=1236 RepID=UPI002359FFAA|nr:hypothetical protein [Pseudoalteromonas sp. GABNS16G]MDC9603231.1 hypothetical protein [Pseudoalteromonas sp. GABNS16G]